MKKTIILCALMALTAINANAQLEVGSNGKVAIGSTNPNFYHQLSVGNTGESESKIGISAKINDSELYRNVAIKGYLNSYSYYPTTTNFGVVGIIKANSNNGRNFGVSGMVDQVTNMHGGTGLFASTSGYSYSYPPNIQGIYAAYFIGSTNLQGQTIAQEIYTPADNILSEDVENLATRGGKGMLDNLLSMNVREFKMKSSQPVKAPDNIENLTDEVRQSYECMKKEEEEVLSRRHFGLSAQELKEIYPNLVLEAQNGYLYINYIELVPVLIRAIQELKGELDEVKGNSGSVKRAPVATAVNTAIGSGNVLYQNTPNPFKEQTSIRFSLADDTQSASICIFDMTGKMLKNIPVSKGDTSVSLNGWELGEGMFLYTLIVNGKEIDTKRMIITK